MHECGGGEDKIIIKKKKKERKRESTPGGCKRSINYEEEKVAAKAADLRLRTNSLINSTLTRAEEIGPAVLYERRRRRSSRRADSEAIIIITAIKAVQQH